MKISNDHHPEVPPPKKDNLGVILYTNVMNYILSLPGGEERFNNSNKKSKLASALAEYFNLSYTSEG